MRRLTDKNTVPLDYQHYAHFCTFQTSPANKSVLPVDSSVLKTPAPADLSVLKTPAPKLARINKAGTLEF